MKSIKRKITLIILFIVVVLSGVLGAVTSYLNFRSSQSVLDKTMPELATVAAGQISSTLENYQNISYEVGCVPDLSNPAKTTEEKRTLIDMRSKAHGFERGNIIGTNGISIFDGNDYSDRDYFQKSMAGQTVCSDPIISKITGKITFVVSAPIWRDGVPNSAVTGVVYFVPHEEFLNNAVSDINVGSTGSAYILSKTGMTIASEEVGVAGVENRMELAKSDSAYASVGAVEQRMVSGETGSGSYKYQGQQKMSAFAPIPGTDGWSVAITVQQQEFLAGVSQSILLTVAIVAVFLLIGILVAVRFGNSMAKPIQACAQRLRLLATGDLTTPVPESTAKDETGGLLRDLGITVAQLRGSVADVSGHLERMAKGDLSQPITMEYSGDFVQLRESLKCILDSFNEALGQIHQSAEQVSSEADQMSTGAQALSQGATEQAHSVEGLVATITGISEQIQDSAMNAVDASMRANAVGEEIVTSNEKMKAMMAAMAEISASSGEIGKIIKTIEDIAFQTNILALNAAVEAARAGNAGKGFAVVADEVRNLASKSAAAAKNTTQLIEKSIHSVEHGTQIADETAKAMMGVVDSAKAVTETIDKISSATEEQALSIGELVQGVDQISSVVQTNSATSQQSAAASEELSGQAQILRELVSHFRLRVEDKAHGGLQYFEE